MSKYKNNEDILSIVSKLQPNCCFKVDFQKVDQHAGGKWLIHDTKRRKDNQLHIRKSSVWQQQLSVIRWIGKSSVWHCNIMPSDRDALVSKSSV